MNSMVRFGTITLIMISLLAISFGCVPKTFEVKDSIISDFPEKGYKMYPSPRDTTEIGSVIGENKDGVRYQIVNLGLSRPDPKLEFIPEMSGDIEISLKAAAELMFGEAFKVQLFDTFSKAKVSVRLSVKGTERQIYTDYQVDDALMVVMRDPKDSIFKYQKYSVIKEVITGTVIDFEISEETVRIFGGKAALKSADAKAKIGAGYEREGQTVYRLRASYNEPMNIFYKEAVFDPEDVIRKKNERGVRQSEGMRLPVTDQNQTGIVLGVKPLVVHLGDEWRPGVLLSGELIYDKLLKWISLLGELGAIAWKDTVSYSTLSGAPDGSYDENNSLLFFNVGARKYFRVHELADLYVGIAGGISYEYDDNDPFNFTGSVLAGVALYPRWSIRTTVELRWMGLRVREREVNFNNFGNAQDSQNDETYWGVMLGIGFEKTL